MRVETSVVYHKASRKVIASRTFRNPVHAERNAAAVADSWRGHSLKSPDNNVQCVEVTLFNGNRVVLVYTVH